MLEEIGRVRAQLTSCLEGAGYTVFSQRHIQADDLVGKDLMINLSLASSSPVGSGLDDSFSVPLVVGIYKEVPTTDAEVEAVAIAVQGLIETDETLSLLIQGIDYRGHSYPPNQDRVFVNLDIEFEITL